MLPATKEQKFQRAVMMFKLGALGDPSSPEARLKLRQRVGDDDSIELTLEDRNQSNARDENLWVLNTGTVPQTSVQQMSLEMHAVHQEEHVAALLSPEFIRNPKAWAALYLHAQGHINMDNAQAMAEQQVMTPLDPSMAGAPPQQASVPAPAEAEGQPVA